MLPHNTVVSLTYAMDFVKYDPSKSKSPCVGVGRGKQHDLKNMGDRDKDLAARWIVDAVVSSVDGPNRLRRALRRIRFRESRQNLCRNLIDQCLGGSNIDKNTLVILFKDLPHSIESRTDEYGHNWRLERPTR